MSTQMGICFVFLGMSVLLIVVALFRIIRRIELLEKERRP